LKRLRLQNLFALAGLVLLVGQFSFSQNAPSLEGLPGFGVQLTGTPDAPAIVNNSGKLLIGFVVRFQNKAGHGPLYRTLLTLPQSAGIPSGSSATVSGGAQIASPGQSGPIVKAILDAVIFGDGQFAGPDNAHSYERLGLRMKAISQVGSMLTGVRNGTAAQQSQVWEQIAALAAATPTNTNTEQERFLLWTQQTTANYLVHAKRSGSDAAFQLAEHYSSIPTLWR